MNNQQSRKNYAPELKIKAVLESFQRDTTIEEIKSKFGIRGPMLHRWRNEFKEKAINIFLDKRNPYSKIKSNNYEPGQSPEELKKIIGELAVQNEILKKAQKLLS